MSIVIFLILFFHFFHWLVTRSLIGNNKTIHLHCLNKIINGIHLHSSGLNHPFVVLLPVLQLRTEVYYRLRGKGKKEERKTSVNSNITARSLAVSVSLHFQLENWLQAYNYVKLSVFFLFRVLDLCFFSSSSSCFGLLLVMDVCTKYVGLVPHTLYIQWLLFLHWVMRWSTMTTE